MTSNKEKDLETKTESYLITAANSPLGSSIAQRLVKSPDNRVLLTSRGKNQALTRLVNNLKDERDERGLSYLPGIDLLDERDLRTLKQEASGFFNQSFHVINCTGQYTGRKPFRETSLDEAQKTIDGTFRTVYNTAYTLLPLMKTNGGGHFIMFGCNSVVYHYPWMAAFTAAKAALESLAVSLAHEYAEDDIHVNVLRLATLQTAREREEKPYGDQRNWIKPSEIAEVVEAITRGPFHLMNGASIDLYRPSPSFYTQSYFERVRRE